MKPFKYIFVISVALMAQAVCLPAQNLDPTVVVDRAYEGKLVDVHKPALEMAVPDTVMRFDLDFDYSVFDNPYKGSYEFQPYLLSMKPSASADVSRRFYLSAGAGYQLHPELDLVWSPDLKTDDFTTDIFVQHRSFIGDYIDLDGDDSDEGWSGFDLASSAGIAGHGDWESGYADFWGKYSNLAVKDRTWNRMYNAAEVGLSVGSKDLETLVDYRIDARYVYGHDALTGIPSVTGPSTENVIGADGFVGFPVGSAMLCFDLDADYVISGGSGKASAGQFGITPHYVYRRARFMADLGVKVAKALGGDADAGQEAYAGAKSEQIVYPDVTLEFGIIPDALKFSLLVGGGNSLDTWASVLKDNHHAFTYVPDFSIERINAVAGFKGRIFSSLSYNLYGGYVNYASGLLDRIGVTVSDPAGILLPSVGHAPYQKLYAGLDVVYKDESLMIDGSVVYSDATGDAFSQGFVRPAAVSGHAALEYNWKRRIYAGVDCRFASERESLEYTLPAYADLGVTVEYVTSRGLSFWVRGGNLLGMTVQRNPLYAEKGSYFTLGIRLNL